MRIKYYNNAMKRLISVNEALLKAFHQTLVEANDNEPVGEGAELGEGTATVLSTTDAGSDESTWPEIGTLNAWRIEDRVVAEILTLTDPAKYGSSPLPQVIKLARTDATSPDSLSAVHYQRQVASLNGGNNQWALWVSEELTLQNGSTLATQPFSIPQIPSAWTREHWTIHVGTSKSALETTATGQIFRDYSPSGTYFEKTFHDQLYLKPTHYSLATTPGNHIYLKRSIATPTGISEINSRYSRFTYRWTAS